MRSETVQDASRRQLLRAFVNGVIAAIGGGLAVVLGRFVSGPARAQSASSAGWWRAVALEDLEPGTPYPAVLAVSREDGWSRARTNEVVFVVWDGLTGVRAMSATCTHLGCRVRWDAGSDRFRCPCHGGAYDVKGTVLSGPPPRPLAPIDARISNAGDVEVRL
jgi:Rieske Fe-S protein